MSQNQAATPAASSKSAIRARLFAEKRRVELVELEDGLVVEVRATSVGQMLDTVAVEDSKQRMATLLIMSCFVPGTSEALFSKEDVDAILEMPSGGYYQKLLDAINKESLERQAAEAKKSLGEVAPSTSSTK